MSKLDQTKMKLKMFKPIAVSVNNKDFIMIATNVLATVLFAV